MFITNPWLHRSVRPSGAECHKSRRKGCSMCMNGFARCRTSVSSTSEILDQQKVLFHTFSKHKLNWLRSPLFPPTSVIQRSSTRLEPEMFHDVLHSVISSQENQGKLSKMFFRRLEKWKQEKINCGVFKAAHKLNCWIYADCGTKYCFCAMKYSFQWKYREKKKSIHKKLMKIPRTIVKSFKRLFRAILGP